MLQFQATILMPAELTLPMVKSDAYARIARMKKLSRALAGGIAALALLAGLATAPPADRWIGLRSPPWPAPPCICAPTKPA
jgi:hypothetical protein